MPIGDDGDRIAAAASASARTGGFSVREHGDPSESADAELFFRIRNVDDGEEALDRAMAIYRAGRKKAGLSRDDYAQASLVPLARSESSPAFQF